jgi:uncharacterized membrane protein YgaE (UPF0421/DUF939 family)
VDKEEIFDLDSSDLIEDESPLDHAKLDIINRKLMKYFQTRTTPINTREIQKYTRQEADQRERQFRSENRNFSQYDRSHLTQFETVRDRYVEGEARGITTDRSNRIDYIKELELKIQILKRHWDIDWTNADFDVIED